MQELRQAQQRLEAALAAGDLEAARAAGRALTARCSELGDASGALAHAGRLADLGLQAAATVHELRQPLAGIKAVAQLVAGSAADPGLVIERATAIERYAEMMEALCDRLRAYARAEPVGHGAGDVNAAVRAALDLLKQLLRKPPVAVETALADSLPQVALDSVGVQQIVVNLVRNARDAVAERQGRIRVATRAVGQEVEVTVSDDGPGVPPEIRERLFTPFASAKASGSGLGLWLSRRLAVEAGGSLELETDDGEGCDGRPAGATFVLRLLRAREA
jgi:two-component system C4-dicarboxylate transport sensor histidine kinase DctB